MGETSSSKRLLSGFLESAESFSEGVELIRVLRSNAFQIGKASVLVRVASDLGKRYFFGLNYITAEEIYNLSNSFVAFVCGSLDRIVFMPTEILVEHLPQISHDRNGEYKIVFTRDLKLALTGRGNRLDCAEFVNNWGILEESSFISSKAVDPTESIHAVIQGRLIEIGNTRGFYTYSPDKSKTFNKRRLDEMARLESCPRLQFTQFESLRHIDVIWFRKTDGDYYPENAFEVELSTGVWSGFGRLATLREYQTRLYIVTHDVKRLKQVRNSFPGIRGRYIHLTPEKIGLLYSAERNLVQMRKDFGL
jgi:hypothetical protein